MRRKSACQRFYTASVECCHARRLQKRTREGPSHHYARELIALGHEVKLMPAQYVKPYVMRSKNDAADAEPICEAVRRPTMRFVAIKRGVLDGG